LWDSNELFEQFLSAIVSQLGFESLFRLINGHKLWALVFLDLLSVLGDG
jgi:hypothetical protein